MSDRESFITEYIYCKDCFAVMWDIFDSFPDVDRHPTHSIISGKLWGLSEYESFYDLLTRLHKNERKPCHPVKMTIIPEPPGFFNITWFPDDHIEVFECGTYADGHDENGRPKIKECEHHLDW